MSKTTTTNHLFFVQTFNFFVWSLDEMNLFLFALRQFEQGKRPVGCQYLCFYNCAESHIYFFHFNSVCVCVCVKEPKWILIE